MAHVRIGQLTVVPVWAKHLRPRWKRDFWKRERKASRLDAIERVGE